MHLLRSALLLVLLLLASMPCLAQQPAVEPADEYFRAYLLNNEAERLVTAGEFQRALDKYQQAQVIFDGIAQNHPMWQPDMLKFRRQRLEAALTDVQVKIANPGKVSPPVAPPALPSPATAPAPTPVAPPAVAPMPATPVPPPMGPSTGDPIQDAINQLYRAMETKTGSIQDQLTKSLAAIGEKSMQLDAVNRLKDEAVKQRDDWYRKAAEEQQRGDKLQAKVVDLEKNGGSKADLEKARGDLADSHENLADAKERTQKAEVAITNLTKRLTEAEMKLTAVEKERDLLKSRPALPDNMKQLLDEKQKLETQLAEAQKQISTLKSDVATRDAEISSLKGQLTKIQGELATLRRENGALETQVADLTLELKKIVDRPVDAAKAKPDEMPKLMAENQLLKGIVMRQIRQQARSTEQKRLIIEEINKSENASKSLIDQVEQLGGQRMSLSEDEKKLFSTPQLESMNDLADLKSTFIAKADPSASKSATKGEALPSPSAPKSQSTVIDDIIEKANKQLADGKLPEAEATYEDVLRAESKNTTALLGLAWARVQQNKLADAEATLRKALSFEDKNSNAHYMLGVTLFRQEKSQDAIAAFEKSLSLSEKNARARHYLGVITSKMGLTQRAEKEFKTALAIDPTYGEADFNLAVLYATSDPPNFDLAKKHYADALKKGVKADANLEKLLNGK